MTGEEIMSCTVVGLMPTDVLYAMVMAWSHFFANDGDDIDGCVSG